MADERKKFDFEKDAGEEVQSPWVTWGSEGDFIKGTLIAMRMVRSNLPDKKGEMTPCYEIKADEGKFHKLDDAKKPVEPGVVIAAGEIYNVGGKSVIERQLRNIKLGTKITIGYVETNPPRQRGYNPFKVIKVFVKTGQDGKPVMDEAWIAEHENAEALKTF